ncbi:MAG: hypothetical protein WCO09_02445 [bacterium]
MKVGLAVFMVVIFLAQNASASTVEAKNFVYKKLNATEVQYFLNNLNALPASGETESTLGQGFSQGINLELLSAQISAHIKNAVEPLLLKEAGATKIIAPAFAEHRSSSNILIYSTLLAVLAILFIERQRQIFSATKSLKLKKLLVNISPRSPNPVV